MKKKSWIKNLRLGLENISSSNPNIKELVKFIKKEGKFLEMSRFLGEINYLKHKHLKGEMEADK